MFWLFALPAGLGLAGGWVVSALWKRFTGSSPSGKEGLLIRGSNVCVTGGSEGIGLAVAEECIRRSAASVTILARTPSKLNAATESLRTLAARIHRENIERDEREQDGAECDRCTVHSIECDVSDPHDVKAAFARIRSNIATAIDLFVSCAGLAVSDCVEGLSVSDCKSIIDTNLMGTILCVREIVPEMIKARGGTICFMLSQASQIGIYGLSVYSASKFGLLGYSQALAMEVAPFNVNVCVAFPADVDTPGYARENERKPKVTHAICGTSGLAQPSHVAAVTLQGIEKGSKRITFGAIGRLLDIATCGFNPPVSFGRTIVEVLLGGVARLLAVLLGFWWKITIASHSETRDRYVAAHARETTKIDNEVQHKMKMRI